MIFKEGHRWVVVRRSFGFSPHIEEKEFHTWRAAIQFVGGHTAGHAQVSFADDAVRGYTWGYLRRDNFPVRIM